MKMKIEVECTPEEARAFLGLPNMEGINQMVQAQMEEQMRKGLEMMTPEAFMKAWMSGGGSTMDAMQQFMKTAMTPPRSSARGKRGDENGDAA